MNIHLKNFKSWSDNAFEFKENSVTLLTGNSGTGKTSIIQAIFFALTGVGMKIVSYNKKSCEVVLTFKHLKITRAKNPTRLVVEMEGVLYHDDAGQSRIDKMFGANFQTISYLSQNAARNFLSLSSVDKMDFLETFASLSHSAHTQEIKTKCNQAEKDKNQQLSSESSKIDVMRLMLKGLDPQIEQEYPFVTASQESYESLVRNEEETFTKNKQRYSQIKQLQLQIQTKLQAQQRFDFSLAQLEQNLSELMNANGCETTPFTLDKLQGELQFRLSLNEYSETSERFQMQVETDKKDLENEIESLILWPTYGKDELAEYISSYKDMLEASEKVEKLTKLLLPFQHAKTINELRDKITCLKSELSFLDLKLCPVCNSTLKIDGRKLVQVKVDSVADINRCDSQIKDTKDFELTIERHSQAIQNKLELISIIASYEQDIPKPESIKADLLEFMTYNVANVANEERKKKLELKLSNKILSKEAIYLKDKTDQSYSQTKKFEKNNTPRHETEIRLNIDEVKDGLLKQKHRQSIENQISVLVKSDPKMNSKDLANQLAEFSNEFESLEQKMVEHALVKTKIDLYRASMAENKRRDSILQEIQKALEKENELQQEAQAFSVLHSKILEAESNALGNFIAQINVKVNFFIDHFFDGEMSVRLKAFKSSKKGVDKPQVNLEVEFKGEESDIGCLSGGEFSKLVLAFNLAFVKLSDSPVVLLDECTSSLDAENTSNVFEKIIDFFPDRLVVAVAHQVIEGQFLSVIKI